MRGWQDAHKPHKGEKEARVLLRIAGGDDSGTALSWETRLFVYENFSNDVVRLGNFGLCNGAQRQ